MSIDRIGVHESTAIDFPFETFREEFASVNAELVPIRDAPDEGGDPERCDAFVTFTHQPRLLSADPEWIHTTLAGIEEFPIEEYERRGITLTNSTGLHGDSVGDTVLGLLLTFARRLHKFIQNQRERHWEFPEWDAAFTLPGERVCVVGLGTVGSAVADRCASLGMDVAGVRRSPEPVEAVDDQYRPDELEAAISGARFVVLCVPLTEATRNLIGASELRAMEDDAYLVNVARGGVVEEGALVDAIETEEIAGVALDVFEEEPLPEESPFWALEDVIVTPHAAVANRDFYLDIAALVRENLDRIGADEEPKNRVV